MSGNGDVLFSMANALKPGIFDLDEMDATYVRAVSFFMGLPGPRHPKQALDLMIAAARKLAHELGGDLKDEQRSVLTAQTIEHYRQRIAEFERKHYNLRR
jgi:cell division protein ZipA